jgi:hypothetical protein
MLLEKSRVLGKVVSKRLCKIGVYTTTDLLRIKGINGKYAYVLFLAGIHSSEMLAEFDVNEVISQIKNRVKKHDYINIMPTKKMIANWIDSANTLIK